jgi:CSLREA domain-containing protein
MFSTPQVAHAATINVETTADNLTPNGLCSLREAIYNANFNNQNLSTDCEAGTSGLDTITLPLPFPAVPYTLNNTGSGEELGMTGDLDITDSLNIQPLTTTAIVIDGNLTDRIFDVNPIGHTSTATVVTLNNLRLQNGSVSGNGGGIQSREGLLDLQSLLITGNAATGAGSGGGVWAMRTNGGRALVSTSTVFHGNDAGVSGGGLWLHNSLPPFSSTPGSQMDGGGFFDNAAIVTGGAIANGDVPSFSDSHLTLNGVQVGNDNDPNNVNRGNAAARGGGIYSQGFMTATAATNLVENNATDGGGGGLLSEVGSAGTAIFLYFGNGSTEVRSNASVATAVGESEGGGISMVGGTVSVSDVKFTKNSSEDSGGAAYTGGGTLFFDRVNVGGASASDANTSANGGGVGLGFSGGEVFAEHSAFIHNSASNDGGGFHLSSTGGSHQLTLVNSTVSTNTASANGGGIFSAGTGNQVSVNASTLNDNNAFSGTGGNVWDGSNLTVYFRMSIIANGTKFFGDPNNCNGQSSGNFVDVGFNIDSITPTGCNMTNPSSKVGVNPQLGPLGFNGGTTYNHVPQGGPALNAVDPNFPCPPPNDDQRGVSRPQSGACDIGSIEVVPSSGGGSVAQCSDGVDNDGDGKIDFTGNGNPANKDPGCESPEDNSEAPDPTQSPSPSASPSKSPTQSPSPSPTEGKQCSNGIDDDGDGKIDFESNGTGDDYCVAPEDDEEDSVHPRCGMAGVTCGTDGPDKLKGSEVYGGDGNDVCVGTVGPDILFCGGGSDVIRGKQGSDFLRSTSGSDRIVGGGGNDRIKGGGGDDFLRGGKGNDRARGGAGDDSVRGRSGNDRLVGGEGNDLVVGNSGDDYLRGSNGDDTLLGGGGTNVCVGGPGKDKLKGCT